MKTEKKKNIWKGDTYVRKARSETFGMTAYLQQLSCRVGVHSSVTELSERS